uniref:Single-stranded DNA-binding protein n=1 Tax=uncultured bacterium contig00016 TaxID=1181507 RepID=A0A806K019_9BACT|nr:single-stranded DNA-binding protein [uncultured bacterium contig00016]
MAYLNKVMLMGNLGKDAEVRMTQSNKKRVSFSLATTRRFRNPNTGEMQDDTAWHNIVAWDRLAERIEKLGIKKGTPLFVEGRVSYRQWNDPQTGQRNNVTEILMDNFEFLAPRQGYGNDNAGYEAASSEFGAGNVPPAPVPTSDSDEQLPF